MMLIPALAIVGAGTVTEWVGPSAQMSIDVLVLVVEFAC